MGKVCVEDYTLVIVLCLLFLINISLVFYATYQGKSNQSIIIHRETEVPRRDSLQDTFIKNIYNPLTSPEAMYHGNYDSYSQNQMIGFLNGPEGQFPVFSRQHTPGRSDRMEYYTINNERGRVKIPIITRNYSEIYDSDIVEVPELGGPFTFVKYANIENRYNPNY